MLFGCFCSVADDNVACQKACLKQPFKKQRRKLVPKMLDTIVVGGVTLRNRIMFIQSATEYEAEDGSTSLQSREFYTRLVHGGAGYTVPGVEATIAIRWRVELQAQARMRVGFAR